MTATETAPSPALTAAHEALRAIAAATPLGREATPAECEFILAAARNGITGERGTGAAPVAVLLEQAQEAIAFQTERAETAEAKAAKYEDGITWETTCLSCASVLNSCYEETARREKAEAVLARVRELAAAFRHGLPTREKLTEADCGRAILALLGPQPDAGGRKDSGTADGMPEGGTGT